MIKPVRLLMAVLIAGAMALLPFTHFGAGMAVAGPAGSPMEDQATPGHLHGPGASHADAGAKVLGENVAKSPAKSHDCEACQQCPVCTGSPSVAGPAQFSPTVLLAAGDAVAAIPPGTGPPPNQRPPST